MNLKIESHRISVAMATYNGGDYIGEQLDSLVSQSLSPFELIVTDDGSTDRTLDIVREFADKAPFDVRIFQNEERLGYGDNFLKAASLCKGDLVAFCDQDDVWDSRKLEICVREFDDEKILLCVHGGNVWNGEKLLGRRFPDIKVRQLLSQEASDPLSVYQGFAMIFRRSILELLNDKTRPEDINCPFGVPRLMAHDQWVWFLSSIFGKIILIPDTLVFYRQHEQNVFGAGRKVSLFKKFKMSMHRFDYSSYAEYCEQVIQFLNGELITCPKNSKEAVESALQKFTLRARMVKLRSLIYEGTSGLSQRTKSFWALLRMGGYFPDKSGLRLGPRSALKDLSYGVSGIYKTFLLSKTF